MEWYSWIYSLLLLTITSHVESSSLPETWYDWCPSSYEEWQGLVQSKSSQSVLTVPYGRLGMTLADPIDLSQGYKPLAQYEFNLKMHPGEKTASQFQVVVFSDSDCGGGTLLATDNTTDVSQIFCMHRVESTKHHLTVNWQAPECGCVTLMSGAITPEGAMTIGQDTKFEGLQAHKLCPDPDYMDNKLHSGGLDTNDVIDDVLDPAFYGLLEDDELTYDDSDEEIDYTEDLYEDEDEDDEIYDAEDDKNVVDTDTDTMTEKRPCKKRACKKARRNPGIKKAMKKKIKKKLSKKQTPDINTETNCQGQICKKINNVITKHLKLSYIHAKANAYKKICWFAKKEFPVKDEMLQELGDSHMEWIGVWQEWRNNITLCCEQSLRQRKECVNTVGPLHALLPDQTVNKKVNKPKKVELTDDEKLTRVCGRVTKLEWEDRRKPPKYHKADPLTQQNWQDIWTMRRQKVKDCCEVNDISERMTCIEDLKADRIDDYCDSEDIGLHKGYKWKHASKKCCEHEDDERYECFIEALQWKGRGTRKNKNQQKGSKDRKGYPSKQKKGVETETDETDPRLSGIRNKCCSHGQEEGVSIHGKRWGKCNKIGVTFVDSIEHLKGAKSNMCKKVTRRCCLKQSRRTTVEETKP